MTRALWVDFNDVDAAGNVVTYVDFAEELFVPEVGELLLVGDGEGNAAKAVVLSFEPPSRVALHVQPGTFSRAPVAGNA